MLKVTKVLGIAVIAGFGSFLLFRSYAATPSINVEPEAGTLAGSASIVTDAGSSAGRAVRFATASAGGVAVCPAFPAFPDANCTGWEHTGVTLRKVPSQVTSGTGWSWEGAPLNYLKITSNNAMVDSVDVAGCVYVDPSVNTATIKRSRITGNCDYMIRYGDTDKSTALSVIDTEIVGGAVQHKGAGFNWLRVNSHGFSGKGAMTGSGSTVEDSWFHDQICSPPDHQSAVGTNGGSSNVIIRHNNVDFTPSECTSGGISNYDDFGPFHNILIEKNLINSDGYCLKAGFEDNNAAGNSGMQVLNNVFGRKYNANCGSFGLVSNWMPGVTGNVWSGNTWGGGAASTSAHAIGDRVDP